MRLFIAITFTDEMKENLNGVMQELKNHVVKGTFTYKENLHLTLVFIGETKELDIIKQGMKLAIVKTKAKAFDLSFEGLSKFKLREGDTYWVGVKQNTNLANLTRALVIELKSYGFYIEDREFKPHLTIGRRIVVLDGFDISEFEASIPPMVLKVDSISLLKSERIEGKLVYTEVDDCVLNHI